MDLQNHGMPQQRDDHPGLVPGKSGMEADIYNGADAAVIETVGSVKDFSHFSLQTLL